MFKSFAFGSRPTLNIADVYPNMGRTPPVSQSMSGPISPGGVQPSHVLLGILGILILARFIYEYGD